MASDDIRRYSADELAAMRARGEVVPTRADASAAELDDAFWREARVVMPAGKTSVHLRVDTDVLDWFKAQGRGHLTRMNAVLRAYVEAHRAGRGWR
ncbi:MAG TPA: BrnA antitoxin family protein [Hyphomicrobiales bacterium]|nr:BrnA antitoxin family protein [Hyphomicrobiales bacterium]